MWEQIVNLAISNGLFAVMFLGLFIYQLRDSKNREIKYQETISKLGDSLQVVKEVKQDFEKDFEFLKFTVTETSYYKFDASYLNIYIYNQDKRMVIQIIPWSDKEVYLKEGTYYIVLEHKYVEEPVSEIEVTKK